MTTPNGCPYASAGVGGPTRSPLNPADPAFAANPYPYYARLRDSGPACRVKLANGSHAWLVTGYDEVRAMLADSRFSNVPPRSAGRPKADSPAQRARALLARHMLNMDAPDHTRMRRLVTATFTPRRVDALRPRVENLVSEVLGQIPRGATVDLVDAFAFPLPVLVISEVLGVPPTDRAALRGWTYQVGSPADALPPGALDEAWSNLRHYFSELIEKKRETASDDLFSALIHSPGDVLSGEELLAMAFLLLFAGYETTMNLLASAVLLLLTYPKELPQAHWPHVVEETLRYASPLEGTTWRRAKRDIDFRGVVIPEGASVLGVLAAANRDPRCYPRPDVYLPGRWAPPGPSDALASAKSIRAGSGKAAGAAPHLAFGYGPHYCVGTRLARLEAVVALPALFAAFPGLRLATDPTSLPYRPGLLVRGPRELPVMTGA